MQGRTGPGLVQAFLVPAEELNFRDSAELLALEESALTRRTQKLAHPLSFKLLERTTRKVSLTQDGRFLYGDNEHLPSRDGESVEAARRISEGKSGLLRIAYMAFAAIELMPRAIACSCRTHPHVETGLRYIRTQAQKLALAGNEIDSGYMIGPFGPSDRHCRFLSSEPLHLVTPAAIRPCASPPSCRRTWRAGR